MKHIKQTVALLLALLLVFTIAPFTAAATGTDSAADDGWIAISTAEEFLSIKDNTLGSYYLTNDIDFDSEEYQYLIGTNFSGVLDGRGHSIYGFSLVASGHTGVFSGVFQGAIRNLTIGMAEEPIQATVTVSGGGDVNFGFLAAIGAGQAGVEIENVQVYGEAAVTVSGSTGSIRAGGLVGYGRTASFRSCAFNGSLAITGSSACKARVGGFIGESDGGTPAVIEDSAVTADLSASHTDASGEEYVGGFIGYSTHHQLYIEDSTTAGTYTGATTGRLAGALASGKRVLAVGGSSTAAVTDNAAVGHFLGDERLWLDGWNGESTPTRRIGDFENFDPDCNYIWLIGTAEEFRQIGQKVTGAYTAEDGTAADYTYPENGFYRLDSANQVIDFGTAPVENGMVSDAILRGVLDGNGHTLYYNLEVDSKAGDANTGLFKNLNSATILNLNLGSPERPLTVSACNDRVGLLTGYAAGGQVIRNVNAYVDMTVSRPVADGTDNGYTGRNIQAGGLIGYGGIGCFSDCNVYGSIALTGERDFRTAIGGFIGQTDNVYILHSCNNFADITSDATGTGSVNNTSDRVFLGGLVGTSVSIAIQLSDCANFGAVTNASKTSHGTDSTLSAAGMVGTAYQHLLVVDCANFGPVAATGSSGLGSDVRAGAAVAFGSAINVRLNGFGDYGTVTGTTDSTLKFHRVGCTDAADALLMDEGAAVRLSGDTGLRFTAQASAALLGHLAGLPDTVAAAWGMLISPNAFVTAAEGFTHRALDAWAAAQGFDAAAGEKAYVDVAKGEEWFQGREGAIAGSVTQIPASLYNTLFDGVAYLTVTGNGSTVFTLYASNPQSRSISAVAKAALDDTYAEETTAGGYTYDQLLAEGETYYADGEAKTVAAGERVYSCYSKAQRDILNAIVSGAE